MVNSTRASQKAKDEENVRVTRSREKAKINGHPNLLDTDSTRKSTRETPLRKTNASSSSTQKSEQVEKATLPAPEARRKSERVEKKKTPSPLTKSGKTRNPSSSSSPSDSKSAGSLGSISRQKLQKEKSVKQLAFEAPEVTENEEHNVGTSQVKIKRMDARMYRSLFKDGKKGTIKKLSIGNCSDNKEVSKNGTLPSEDAKAKETRVDSSIDEQKCQSKGDNCSGAKIDELSKGSCSDINEVSKHGTLPSEDDKANETRVDSRLSGPMTNLAENNVTPGSFIPSNTPTYETSVVPIRVQSDCCREETLPTLASGNSILDDDDMVSNNAGLGGGENLAPSKRKVITVDTESNVSSTISKGDNANLIPDALPSKLGGNESCSKRTRLDYNPTVKESCDPCAAEDEDDTEPTMVQKDKSDYTSGIGHLKDSAVEDKNVLALDGQNDNEKDSLIYSSNESVVQPKEKLSSHIANRCKSDSYRFVEYWVPAQISHVQLEQYCATLLSNSSILCSSPKIDCVGAIRDVLISIRKCCNHPYVNDPSVQTLLFKDLEEVDYPSDKEKLVEYLNVGIKASGKLQLLDSMLTELRKNNLRALVLFQSIGKDSIGDILDDFLRQRFDVDSFERIDKSLSSSKKQAAMKKFNDKNNKRFVFLMETSACLPSIKLSSIDTVIIFDSDWNPMNDLRSLQKITLDSQFQFIKMFRLYTAFTAEEKALILATQDKALDINCLYSSRGLNHTLLMWGASRLFDELGVSLDGSTSTSSPIPLLEKTVSEFTSCLSDAGEDSDTSSRSILLKVQQNGGSYCSNFPLLGELKLGSLDEESPQTFWTKLLEGKHFRWKYSSSPSQRSRKRVHCFNNLEGGTNPVNEGITKKRMKVSNNTVDQPTSKSEGEKLPTGVKAGIFGDLVGKVTQFFPSSNKPQDNGVGSEKNGRIHDEQRSLHLLLKPQITKLCDVLLLPDNVKNMVDNFLEYVMNHHHVDREPVSILQAFQISLIWTAASLLNHKLDHKASLILAEQNLNFDCKKGEVDLIFSMLRCLKKIFLHRTENCNNTSSPKASKSPRVSCTGVAQEVELFKKDLSKSIKKIQKKCEKTLNKIRLMHQEEKQRLRESNEAQKAELERKYTIELAFTRSCSPNEVTRIEMLKILNIEHQKRIEDLEFQYETSLKDLEDKHSAHILKVQDCETTWVEDLKSWAKNELRNIVALKELGTGFDYSQMCDNVAESMKETGAVVPQKNSPSVDKTVEQQNSLVKHDRANEMDIMVSNDRPVSGNEDHNTTENQHVSQENILSKLSHSREQNSDGATSMTDEAIRSGNFGHESRDGCEKPSLDTACLPDCREQNSDCATSMTDEDNRCANFGHRSRDGCEIPSLGTACLPDCENATHPVHQCSDGVSSSVPEGQIPGEVQETTNGGDSVSVSERQVHVEMSEAVNFTDCLLQSPPSYVAQISDRGSIDVPVIDGVSSPRPCQAACSTSCRDTISLSKPPLEQQIPDGLLSIPDGDIPVTVPENSHAVADCHKDIEPSTNAVLVDNSTTNDLEGGVLGTVTSAPVSSRPVNVMEPLEQGQQLPSVESAADKDSAGEMQNSYDQVQLASRSADVVPANQITVPPKQVHQLAAAELSSNLGILGLSNFHLATEDEHQPSNVPDIPTHHPEPSSAVPNKNVAQPHSNSALFLHSNQAAVHPVSNSDLDSVTASRVRTQSANPRNLSTPLEMNNHPIQSTAPSSSTRLPHLSYDPLKIEFEKIQKAIEQTSKSHEDSKLRLKSDFEKELAELRKKYDVKFQEMEVEFQRTKKILDTNLNTVCVNKLLADAFRSKCLDLKAPGASGMQHDSLPRQLHQRSSQQTATRSLVVSGSSGQPPATSLLSPSIAPSQPPATSLLSPPIAPKSQHMVPPGYNKSGTSSGVSARPPLINTTRSSIARDVQTGGEIRAPAPHLQSSRPPNSVPPSSFHPLLLRNLSQTAPSNLRATSPSHARVPPLQRPTTHQSNPQTGYRPDSAGRLATPNLPLTGSHGNVSNQSNITSPNVISRLSDTAPANLSRFGPNSSSMVVNSSHQAASADLVCLSDDDD
ncbi:unnamed protein product [Trifolium pratense]|uniref:Uncharacterized protein n=1 Tax=Trifolium pratense TaxID=57577 RepID=A0ACB0KWS7_TRIPR|nr:unnamed protein product [Trifolium pratense]